MITTKEKMCDSAIELFNKFGFENISINKICEQFNVTRGSFYHHFESKNDLLLYWFSQHLDASIKYDSSISSPKETLRNFILSYAILIKDIGEDLMFHIFMAELELKGEHFSIYFQKKDLYIRLIDEAKSKGEITSSLPTYQLLEMYSSAFLGTVLLWRFNKGNLNLTENINNLFEAIYK